MEDKIVSSDTWHASDYCIGHGGLERGENERKKRVLCQLTANSRWWMWWLKSADTHTHEVGGNRFKREIILWRRHNDVSDLTLGDTLKFIEGCVRQEDTFDWGIKCLYACVCVFLFISVIVDEKLYKDYLYSNGEFCYLKKVFFPNSL